jgi:hypothetical protein
VVNGELLVRKEKADRQTTPPIIRLHYRHSMISNGSTCDSDSTASFCERDVFYAAASRNRIASSELSLFDLSGGRLVSSDVML